MIHEEMNDLSWILPHEFVRFRCLGNAFILYRQRCSLLDNVV